MTTPTVRELVHNSASGSNLSVVTGSGTQVGDWLVAFHGEDWVDATTMGGLTGTSGTWTQRGTTADLGTNNSHLKCWTRQVAAGGAQTVTATSHSSDEVFLHVYVLTGVNTIADAVASATGSISSLTAAAPSVSPTGVDDLLLCCWMSGGGADMTGISAPSGMTNLTTDTNFVSFFSARQALSASGSTGVRNATASPNTRTFCAMSLAVKGNAAATPFSGWGVPIN